MGGGAAARVWARRSRRDDYEERRLRNQVRRPRVLDASGVAPRGGGVSTLRPALCTCRWSSPRHSVTAGRRSTRRDPDDSQGSGPSIRDLRRALSLLSGNVVEDRFWSDSWTDTEQVLSRLTDWLRRSHAVPLVEIDEGWSVDRDLSVPFGWWGWLDIRALVEDHGVGRILLRLGTHIRPTSLGVATGLGLGEEEVRPAMTPRWSPR